jgi:predicted nucleotidyltransferase
LRTAQILQRCTLSEAFGVGVAGRFSSNYDDVVMGRTIAEMRSAHAAALDRALETAIDSLAELPEVEKVIVFGSYQRGRRDLLTDLDLLVIMRSSESFLCRTERLYRLLGGKMRVDFDLVAYSPEEIARNASNPFLKRALEEGRVVYERPG